MEDTIIPSMTYSQACVVMGISAGALQALVDTGKLKEQRVGDSNWQDGFPRQQVVRFTHEDIAECIGKLSTEWREDGE